MQYLEIIGKSILVTVSEPWDFGTQLGCGPFQGKILRIENEVNNFLLELNEELIYNNEKVKYFVGSPRHEGCKIDDILGKKEGLICGLTKIPLEKATLENPFDLSWWRGGIGLIATVKIK